MKTHEEVERLIANWNEDPCWDLETTEGFEEHYDKLLAYSTEVKRLWEIRKAAEFKRESERLGITDRPELVKYILNLELRLVALSQRIEKLESAGVWVIGQSKQASYNERF